ncbi:hypothetical protein B484DRAFT_401732 [Ochromonadaceae sp. CCMP2298]|nr:hypothetical protein B484DRAFT_401732 [Ochromonadaceae sp. CCMP2298]
MPPKRTATQANLSEEPELEGSAVSPRMLYAGVTPYSFPETRPSLIPAWFFDRQPHDRARKPFSAPIHRLEGPKLKNGKKVTEAYVVTPYAVVDDRHINLGFFVYGVYDKYRFFKGDVEANGDVVVENAAGHAWPGPTYLPLNTPVRKFIVDMTFGQESVDLQSLKIDVLDGQPDNSNVGNTFSVTVTVKELDGSEWAMLLCLRG